MIERPRAQTVSHGSDVVASTRSPCRCAGGSRRTHRRAAHADGGLRFPAWVEPEAGCSTRASRRRAARCGVYVLAYASMVFGRPVQIRRLRTSVRPAWTSRRRCAEVCGGQIASLTCAVRTPSPAKARASTALRRHRKSLRSWRAPVPPDTAQRDPVDGRREIGFQLRSQAMARCAAARCESPNMPLDETLSIAENDDE